MSSSPAPTAAPTAVPAQLAFLAIYNPSLGSTDETIDDQIVYYYSSASDPSSPSSRSGRRHRRRRALGDEGRPAPGAGDGGRNERLRQIGLAQGMVEFGRGFSGGRAVESVDTEKSRVVLRELEAGWWILASIDLTRVPLPAAADTAADGRPSGDGAAEYSSREVKPAGLLVQDLLRAHSVFLLHHGGSLGAALGQGRARLAGRLRRYWDLFLSSWNVMLHANPARDVFGGIKVAACGELGVGVGEEERGSGEREVLEGFVGRVEGLVDLVVSRFGGDDADEGGKRWTGGGTGGEGRPTSKQPWLGTGNEPGGEDGAVFLGVGALSRLSLRDVTYWVEDLYVWGENAYGVVGSPATNGQARRKTNANKPSPPPPAAPPLPPSSTGQTRQTTSSEVAEFGPPPPLIGPGRLAASRPAGASQTPRSNEGGSEGGGMDKFVNYLKMGYGTYWTLGSSPPGELRDRVAKGGPMSKADNANSKSTASQSSSKDGVEGYYIIGLMGDVDEDGSGTDTEDGHPPATHRRTLTVELANRDQDPQETEAMSDPDSRPAEPAERRVDGQDGKKTKLRVVVYVNAPFIFTFLFEPGTQSLTSEDLYQSLHHQLAPLRKALINSTAYRPGRPNAGSSAAHIYDLVWDPTTLTVHSTIPNIPDPKPGARGALEAQVWSRLDALNTHTQVLNIFAATRADHSELDRTAKTSRGWWIVWSRVVERETGAARASSEGSERRTSSDADSFCESGEEAGGGELQHAVVTSKEIFLVRRAGDHGSSGVRGVSGSYVGGGGGWTDGASRLAQGIGVDTRKYIEDLLSLNR